jgi:hypothetical protein
MESSQSLVTLDSLLPKKNISFVYQDETNQYRAEESIQSVSRIQIQSPTLSLGSKGVSFVIQNSDVINATILHIELPPVPANVTMERGWGLKAISLLTIFLAGASPYQQDTYALYASLLRQSGDDQDKRNAILELAGNEVTQEGQIPRATIYLTLPWSSARYGGPRTGTIGFDSALIRAPIRLSVDFANFSEFAYGSGVAAVSNAMTTCYVQARSDVFRSAKDMEFRERMASNANMLYSYSFYYNQTYTSAPFAGSIDSSNPAIVSLSGFRNASLLSMTLLLERVTTEPNNNTLYFEPIKTLRLNYNGSYLFRFDSEGVQQAFDMEQSACGTNDVDATYNDPLQVTSPFTLQPVKSNWTTLVLAARDEISYKNTSQTGLNLSNQTVTLELTTEGNSNVNYRVRCVYSYAASFLLNNSNAEINYQ